MRDKKFLPPIILALTKILSVGWLQFVYEPIQREILNMELETRRLREIEREIFDLKARKDLSAFLEEKDIQLDAMRNFLPETLEEEKFIDELYQRAEFLGVKIISIRAGTMDSSEEIQSQVVNVNLSADYISLVNFIREVIDGGRLTSLESISIEKTSGKSLSCNLNFKIFATVR